MPAGWRVGSTIEYWPITQERPVGDQAARELGGRPGQVVDALGDVQVPARRASSAVQGIGPSSAQSTFTVELSYWKAAGRRRSRAAGARAHQVEVERRRATSASTPLPAASSAPLMVRTPDGPAAPNQHCVDADVALQLPPVRPSRSHQRGGQLAGAPLGHGEAALLAEAAQHPAEQATAGGFGGQVGVQRVAGQQPGAARRHRILLGQAAHRQQREAPEAQQPARSQRRGQPRAAAQRGKRAQQRVDERAAGPLPVAVELAPSLAVAGGEALQRGGGLVEVERDDRTGAVGLRMGDRQRRAPPAQPVVLEPERLDRGRGGGQRVEGAEQVAA